MAVIAIRLPNELIDQIDEWGAERGMTRSESIRRWIKNGVDERWRPLKQKPASRTQTRAKAAALAAETLYLATVPATTYYRRLVDRREKQRLLKLREQRRESQIKGFDPREREAVEYLKWMKNQIYSNYSKFTGTKEIPSNIQSLDQRWEDFVDLLDVYRRRKHHLRSINRQAVQNQLVQAERAVEASKDDREKRVQQANAEILKRRVAAFNDIERSVKLVEGQLQSIENFFGLVNDQVVTLPTPERVSSLDFEQLSDSIALTKQMLEETSDTFAALDTHNRDIGNYELLLSGGTSSK
jgi:hypothetical protein